MNLDQIKTIVVVMMENRSFDNLLGYLTLPPHNRRNVTGLGTAPGWGTKVASHYKGASFPPFLLTDPYDVMDADPPHERGPIATQMGTPVKGVFPMDGFVTNYASAKGAKPVTANGRPPVMGYFTAEQAPVTSFFAEKYAICDHWFSSLPAGTQPNRLMAMSGFSKIEVNQVPLPDQDLVYDWLTRNKIRWRVYHEDMPFFSMMLRWVPDILLENHFRPFARLFDDVQNEPPGEFPQVIFVEPTYTDAPHLGLSSDDHAPSAIKGGQKFLLEVYRAMTRVPDVWKGTVMVVTYDEHGGFFDHVSPPAIKTDPPPGDTYPSFNSLGVRVPAFVLSPFVKPGTVYNGLLDHTSVLKFIGQKFGPGGRYSDLVDQRPTGSVIKVLNASDSNIPAAAIPSLNPYLAKDPKAAGFLPGKAPETEMQEGFQKALDTIRQLPEMQAGKFDGLLAAFPPRNQVQT
jgi:phospholipase C